MRVNTIVVDVSVVPVRPKAADIEKFLLKELSLDVNLVKSLQLHNVRNCVYIEFDSKQSAECFAASHHLKHSIVSNNASFKIPVYLDDGATKVRVHDVPPQMPNEELVGYLNRYGEVMTIANEVWRNFFMGLPNGVRVARMKLRLPIPSYLQIGDDVTLVTYKNQVSTCRHCGLRVHRDMKCLEAAAQQKIQKQQQQQQQQEQQQQQQKQQHQHQQQKQQQQGQQLRKPVPNKNSNPTVIVDCTEAEQKGMKNNKRNSQNDLHPTKPTPTPRSSNDALSSKSSAIPLTENKLPPPPAADTDIEMLLNNNTNNITSDIGDDDDDENNDNESSGNGFIEVSKKRRLTKNKKPSQGSQLNWFNAFADIEFKRPSTTELEKFFESEITQ